MDAKESLQVRESVWTATTLCERAYTAEKEWIFLPGAVSTVNFGIGRQVVTVKVVLSLLRDADVFKHVI